MKVKEFPSGQEVLKTIAIARILLPNIPHIKAYWASLGINLAIVAQEFGAEILMELSKRKQFRVLVEVKAQMGF